MYTSYFANLKKIPADLVPVSIAVGTPRWFRGRREPRLCPTRAMLGSPIEEYNANFAAILARLDPVEVFNSLGENAVLLCWEAPGVRCHRRWVAEWIEAAFENVSIPELGFERSECPPFSTLKRAYRKKAEERKRKQYIASVGAYLRDLIQTSADTGRPIPQEQMDALDDHIFDEDITAGELRTICKMAGTKTSAKDDLFGLQTAISEATFNAHNTYPGQASRPLPAPTVAEAEKLRALSIRQPYGELVMTGKKVYEFRSKLTHIRGRVYVYACKAPGKAVAFERAGLNKEDLPFGMLVGTVEIVDCVQGEHGFKWVLANPQRLETPLPVTGVPQPGFFWPFGRDA